MKPAIGQPLDRRDGRQKVTGAATYAAEWNIPKIAHAVLVTSAVTTGTIKSINTKKAAAVPGVLTVLTHENIFKMRQGKPYDPNDPTPGSDPAGINILQTTAITWNGQPVAVVVAETLEQAIHAGKLVDLVCEERKFDTNLDVVREKAFIPKMVSKEEPEIRIGDADKALLEAAVKVDNIYHTPRQNHNAIELHGTIAHWEAEDKLTVYDASQYIHGVKKMLSDRFFLKEDNVQVLSPVVGGGFGGKGVAWPHVFLSAAAAKAVNRPVKLVLSRQQVYRTVGGRPATVQRVALGAGKDGKLTSLIHMGTSATSMTTLFTEQFTFPARHLYASPNIFLGQKVARLDIVPPTFMRAPGETPGTFALESAMDELSYALKIDPVQLRAVNEPEKDPTLGTPFSIRNLKKCFAMGAEKFGWAKRQPEPRSMKDGPWQVGYGTATAYYPTYQNASDAKVTIFADGTAIGKSGTHDMGMGTITAQAQSLADLTGLPVEKVKFEIGDTKMPFANVTGGSSTTLSVAGGVKDAVDKLKRMMLEMARKDVTSPLNKAKLADVELRDGGIFIKGQDAGETYADILKKANLPFAESDGQGKPQDDYKEFSIHSYGAHFVEVRVDERLGMIQVKRIVSVFDCGKIINKKTAESQFKGGLVMGIGAALMEETMSDDRFGRIMNADLAEYHVPVNRDIPEMEVHYLDKPDPHTPLGAHGIGELSITGIAAAIANAVFHATGKRIRETPITVSKVLA